MRRFATSIVGILLIGFLIRVMLAFTYDTGDTGAFCHASALLLQGKPVYSDPNVYFSGPPFALHLTGVSHWLADHLHLPCSGMWKMPTILADIGIGYLIYVIARKTYRRTHDQAKQMLIWYIYNPIAIFISGFHGQQDPFWIFFVLCSWYCIMHTKRVWLAAILYATALSYKLPSVLFYIPLVFTIRFWKERLLFTTLVGFLFLLSLLPEIVLTPHDLIRQSFLYSSTPGVWGFSGIIAKFIANTQVIKLVGYILDLCLAVSLLTIYWQNILRKKIDFFKTGVLIIAAFYLFTPGFGTQYLLWILPFLILTKNRLLTFYTFLVTLAYLHTYGLQFPPLSQILDFLLNNVYYKTKMLYPYDLYYPIWLLMVLILFQKEMVLITIWKSLKNLITKNTMIKKLHKKMLLFEDSLMR